jgi:O-antigen/teichoic acid export membrane protein
MLTKSRSLILSFFQGHQRTVRAKKNMLASLAIKGMSMVVNFILTPITLGYLGRSYYGIWVVIASFLTYFTLFEIGLGSGLKNKLAEAVAKGQTEVARIYVSTTYAILSIVMLTVSTIFMIAAWFIDWSKVFNVSEDKNITAEQAAVLAPQLTQLAYLVFTFFFIRFVIKLISDVLVAHQRSALSNLFGPLGTFITLPAMYLLDAFAPKGSLILVGLTYSVIPVLVLAGASIYLYSTQYRTIAPSLRFVKFEYAKSLLKIGVKFFVVQVSFLIIFQTAKVLIAQFLGPSKVTDYDIAYQYFSIINTVSMIVVNPYWPAFTEAWAKEDFTWIRKTVKTLFFIWTGFAVMSIVMYFISDIFLYYWIGPERLKEIHIPESLKLLLVLYCLVYTFGSVFIMFINGVGKIQLQTYSIVLGAIMFFPCAHFFVNHLKWGIEGVVVASIIANFYSLFLAPIQYFKIINNKAQGIWNQ